MPDYSVLSLIELKLDAKGRGIKMYYVMKRADLVRILSLPELPLDMRVEKMTIKQLREQAKQKEYTKFWDLPRSELVRLLYPELENGGKTASDKDEKNQCNTDEHDDPKEHNAQ
jgi:hypothetical protein